MGLKCITIRHVAFEDLGVFESVLKRLSFDVEYRQAGIDAVTAEEWLNLPLVVVMGGPISAYERDKYPWLTDEIAGVKRRLAKDMPTMGVCLGAQIMAAALGSRVYPGTAKEIGWGPVSLTSAGKASCLASLDGAPVLHWHGDTFDLPAGAELLASTPITPHQAFAHGNALALQFHPEADGRRIEAWLIGHTCELGHAGLSVSALREDSFKNAEKAARAGEEMMEEWLGRVGLK